ncbi:Tetratricopeptide-like helical domain superfamily [Sesbania bispinosa]|nr:Tetratricopeptide-like helical domain superfamily [Sesbania bispinosa]
MSNKRNYDLTPGDIAKRLNLISRVHGLEQAERFFRGIPDAKIEFKIYAALLSCYADHKSLEEAEAIMKKIKDLRPRHITTCYNIMLKLYARMGKYEKLDRMMQEMREKDICSGVTFNIRLSAYVAVRDIEGMEKLLMQMEADPLATVDWLTYTTAANGYLKVGNFEKALAVLKKSEHLVRGKTRRLAYEYLQTMYAAIGNKDELDDIDGAEKILEEWESNHTCFDAGIPNLMITAYCRLGLLDKAEAYIRRLLDNGKEFDGSAWDRLATGYRKGNDMEKSKFKKMKRAILANRPGRRPCPFNLVACIKYLKEKLIWN